MAIYKDVQAVIEHTSVKLAGWNGTGDPDVSMGHHVHVSLNGSEEREEDYETFTFPGEAGFNFCKTQYRPYDEVITAILIVAAHHAPGAVEVSSDGRVNEWQEGLNLARQATGNQELEVPFLD